MPKRSKRPGLFQRGAVWHVGIYHGGKAIRRSLETEDRERAEEAYDQLRAQLWQEKHLDKTPEPVWEDAALAYVQRFDRMVANGERKERSLESRRLEILTEKLKGRPLCWFTRKNVAGVVADLSSPLHTSSLISAVLGCAVEEDLIAFKPKVIMGKKVERKRYLSNDEARKLLSQAGSLYDLILFSLATGLRQTNGVRLRWSWVKDRTVIIPAEHFKQKHDHVQPLNRTAMAVLQRQIGRHSEFVFAHEGQPYETSLEREGFRWTYRWNQARKGIVDLRWHDLRHTWASWSLQAGVPEPVVEMLGGWHSGKMVRRYAHASVEFLRPYAEMIDPLLTELQHTSSTGVPALEAVK